MGRPIKKRFFGSRLYSESGVLGAVGGEQIASVVTVTTGSGYTAASAITFKVPDLAGGNRAVGTLNLLNGGLNPTNPVTFTDYGTGYLNITSIYTLSGPGSSGALSVSLTTTVPNSIACVAWVPTDTAQRTNADIIKQEASHRYMVQVNNGSTVLNGQCKLVSTSTLASGQMYITATDSASGTYYVTKLTSRKAQLVPISGTQFTSGQQVAWIFTGTPQQGVSVLINSN